MADGHSTGKIGMQCLRVWKVEQDEEVSEHCLEVEMFVEEGVDGQKVEDDTEDAESADGVMANNFEGPEPCRSSTLSFHSFCKILGWITTIYIRDHTQIPQ